MHSFAAHQFCWQSSHSDQKSGNIDPTQLILVGLQLSPRWSCIYRFFSFRRVTNSDDSGYCSTFHLVFARWRRRSIWRRISATIGAPLSTSEHLTRAYLHNHTLHNNKDTSVFALSVFYKSQLVSRFHINRWQIKRAHTAYNRRRLLHKLVVGLNCSH